MPKTTCPLCNDGVPLANIHGVMMHEIPPQVSDLVTCEEHSILNTIPLVYIMSPYTHRDPKAMEQRYQNVRHYERTLTVEFPNALFYSPIAHFHPTAIAHDLPRDIDYWRDKNRCMIHRSQLGIMLRDAGWVTSKGMSWERDLFRTLETPCIYHSPNTELEVVGQALQELA